MGVNDAREQLEVCKDEYGKLERENAELKAALTKECQELAAVTAYSASALGASRLSMGAELVRMGYEGIRTERDIALAQVAELRAVLAAQRTVEWGVKGEVSTPATSREDAERTIERLAKNPRGFRLHRTLVCRTVSEWQEVN